MDFLIIIGIILTIIIAVFLFKVIKNLVKTLIYLALILIIITASFSFFLYRDAKSFAKGIKEQDNLFLLKEDEEYISGFVLSGNRTSPVDDLDYYEDKEHEDILEDNYKLFILDLSAIETTKRSEPAIKYLKGETDFPEDIQVKEGLDLETVAFLYLVVNNFREKPTYLIKAYRDQSLIIYPETFMFKVLKFISR